MEASSQIVIERPVGEVFAFATDVQYFDRWMMGVRDPRWLTRAPRHGHAEFELTFVYAGVPLGFRFEVVGYEKHTRQSYDDISGPFSVCVDMEFVSGEGQTRVGRKMEIHLAPIPLPIVETLGFVAKPALGARIRADLVRLKQCIEGTAVTPGLSGAVLG